MRLDRSWHPLPENPDHQFFITPRKRNVQPADAFEDTDFKPRFDIVIYEIKL